MTSNRRAFVRKASVGAAAVALPGAALADQAQAAERSGDAHPDHGHRPRKEVHYPGEQPPENPLFSPVTTYGSLVFLSGIGAHFDGDIRAHTEHVLDELERNLKAVGSDMSQVLKANVYLDTLDDYDGMNEVFEGRFGPEPGVRTTIAAAAGIPGDSLVEIDVIAVR